MGSGAQVQQRLSITSVTSMPYTSSRSTRKERSPWGSSPMALTWSAVRVGSVLPATSDRVWKMRLFSSMKNLGIMITKYMTTTTEKSYCGRKSINLTAAVHSSNVSFENNVYCEYDSRLMKMLVKDSQNEKILFIWRAVFIHLLRVQQHLSEKKIKSCIINTPIWHVSVLIKCNFSSK